MDTSIVWYHTDQGELPSAFPWGPKWTKMGGGVVTISDEALTLNDNSGVAGCFYTQKAHPRDAITGPVRTTDYIEIQAWVRGKTCTPSWVSGASGICLFIRDGQRALAVSIGSTLALVDPLNGVVYWKQAGAHPWLFGHWYRLVKYGTTRWVLEVDGKQVAELPYLHSAAHALLPAWYGFGCMDTAGSASAEFQQVEGGLNVVLPPQWRVQREFNVFPPAIQTRWNDIGRALLRATTGLVQSGVQALRDAFLETTAARFDVQAYQYTGAALPTAENPAWTLQGAPTVSVVRERVRLATVGSGAVEGYQATFTTPAGSHLDLEYTVGTKLVVRSYTADAAGRVGLFLAVRAHQRLVVAQLREAAGTTGRWEWVLTTSAVTGALAPVLGALPWPVDIFQEHTVELQVLGSSLVLLLVDGEIVDRRPFVVFSATGAGSDFCQVCNNSAAGTPRVTVDLRDGYAIQRMTDLARRPLFEQAVQERLLSIGGCERNDELDTWGKHHHEVEELRGTSVGIVVELRRLSCSDDVWIVDEKTLGSWYLELSWPEVTPIYLELGGYFTTVFIEFTTASPNFTAQQLADLAARYLVPVSCEELQYVICTAARLTAPAAAGPPGRTRLTLTNAYLFTAGDAVTLRNPTNTDHVETTVVQVIGLHILDVAEIPDLAPYTAASVLRHPLAYT